MRTALDAPMTSLDPAERKLVATIRRHGWHRTETAPGARKPGSSYSTGIWAETGYPEVIVHSLKGRAAARVLGHVRALAKAGRPPPIGLRTEEIFTNSLGVLLPIDPVLRGVALPWSRWFYGGDAFQAVQLVWPDAAGRFPWEDGMDPRFRHAQPDLTGADWGGLRMEPRTEAVG